MKGKEQGMELKDNRKVTPKRKNNLNGDYSPMKQQKLLTNENVCKNTVEVKNEVTDYINNDEEKAAGKKLDQETQELDDVMNSVEHNGANDKEPDTNTVHFSLEDVREAAVVQQNVLNKQERRKIPNVKYQISDESDMQKIEDINVHNAAETKIHRKVKGTPEVSTPLTVIHSKPKPTQKPPSKQTPKPRPTPQLRHAFRAFAQAWQCEECRMVFSSRKYAKEHTEEYN